MKLLKFFFQIKKKNGSQSQILQSQQKDQIKLQKLEKDQTAKTGEKILQKVQGVSYRNGFI